MASNVGGQIAGRMAKINREVENAELAAVKRAAADAKKTMLAEIRSAAGGDLVLSKVGKTGGKLGVRYSVKGTGTETTAFLRATGPLQLLENKSRPHTIIPHSVGRAKGRTKVARRQAKQELYSALFGGGGFAGSKPLRTPWGPRYRVQHPGVQNPKQPWKRGLPKAQRLVESVMRDRYSAAMRRGLK